jgi:hypothetical protein
MSAGRIDFFESRVENKQWTRRHNDVNDADILKAGSSHCHYHHYPRAYELLFPPTLFIIDRNVCHITMSNDTGRVVMNGERTRIQKRPGRKVRGCIQKFPYWPPGARTANGTALYH